MDTVKPLESLVKNNEEFQRLFLDIEGWLKTFICFQSEDEPVALANWVVSTYFYRSFYFTPYMNIYSPENGCGKSQLLEILGFFVHNPKPSNIPTNALFRHIENQITLLIDEIDMIAKEGKEELWACINLGYKLINSTVDRLVGKNHSSQTFETYCPKAIAGIGQDSIPTSVKARSINIELQRALSEDLNKKYLLTPALKEKFDFSVSIPLSQLADQVEEDFNPFWSITDYEDCIYLLGSSMSNTRAVDICAPLLTIACMGNLEWANKSIIAFTNLTKRETEQQTWQVELLSLCREIKNNTTGKSISSYGLAVKVNDFLDTRFQNFNNGNGINANQVSRALSGFNIKSKSIRTEGEVKKGFEWHQFEDAFRRYLPPEEEPTSIIVEDLIDKIF